MNSQYDQAFRKVHATFLEVHRIGQETGESNDTHSKAWNNLVQHLSRLTLAIAFEPAVRDSLVAQVVFAGLELLAVGEAAHSGAEQAVAPTVDRLCELAGGKPR